MRLLLSCLAVLIALSPVSATAEDLSTPTGTPVLTISGALGAANSDGAAVFDMAMLEALPSVTFTTTTIWTDGVQSFTGVPLATLLETVAAQGAIAAATAINDYAVEIPVADITEQAPIVAYQRNGAPMSVRDKGPLWIVYPYDSDPAYQSEVIYSRSIWQLDRIVLTP